MSLSTLGYVINGDNPNNGQLPTSEEPAQKAEVESLRGGFFAIDSRIWAKVTALGITEAAVYLVLACGTGHNNRSKSWSTNAAKKYAGMGWARPKPSIERLLAGGFIRCAVGRPFFGRISRRKQFTHPSAKQSII